MSLCGHSSITALFRFELLTYVSISVELRITYLLAIGRTNEFARKLHMVNRPILPALTAVVISHGSCRHLSARSGKPAISRQHTNLMCVDIGTQYPHIHDATFTLPLCQHVDPKIKDPRFHKNGDLVSPSRWGLTPRTSVARWVKQEWLYVCQSLFDCLLVLYVILYRIHLYCDLSKTTSNSSNIKHFRHLCKHQKNRPD